MLINELHSFLKHNKILPLVHSHTKFCLLWRENKPFFLPAVFTHGSNNIKINMLHGPLIWSDYFSPQWSLAPICGIFSLPNTHGRRQMHSLHSSFLWRYFQPILVNQILFFRNAQRYFQDIQRLIWEPSTLYPPAFSEIGLGHILKCSIY